MDKKKFFFFIIVFLILLNIAFAQPPFQESASFTIKGLVIEAPVYDVIPLNKNYSFHFHVFNQSNGVSFDNSTTNCFMHIYDYQTGLHLLEQNAVMDSNGVDFEVNINDSLFSKEGTYFRVMQCNHSTEGGFLGIQFKVGYSLRNPSIQDAMINSLLVILFVIFFLISLIWAVYIDGENYFKMGPDDADPILTFNIGKYVKLFLYLLSYIFFWMLTWASWQMADLFMLSKIFSSVLKALFFIETALLGPMFIVIVIIGFIKHLTDTKAFKLAERNINPR